MEEKYLYIKQKYSELKQIKTFINKYENSDILLGPTTLRLYSVFNNKLFLFFSDVHGSPSTICNNTGQNRVWIDNFLTDLFKVSLTCIDFFAETMLFQQIENKFINKYKLMKWKSEFQNQDVMDEGLTRVSTTFIDCLGPVKTNCKKLYKNVRFHNTEYRRFVDTIYNIVCGGIFILPLFYMSCSPDEKKYKYPSSRINDSSFLKNKCEYPVKNMFIERYYDNIFKQYMSLDLNTIFYEFLQGVLYNNIILINQSASQLMEPFKEYLDDSTMEAYKIYMLQTKLPYKKIKKQFDALDEYDNNLSKMIIDFTLEKYNKIISQLIENIKDIYKKNNNNIEDFQINFFEMIAMFSTLFVDAYTIARLMKITYLYKDARLIIVYAGATHIANYLEFLDIVTKKENPNNSTYGNSKYIGCINIMDNELGQYWKAILQQLEIWLMEEKVCSIKKWFR